MKLYTEEQVRATWNTAFMEGMSIDSEIYEPIFFEDYLNSLTPIELPSDEEIEKQSKYWNETTNPDMWTFKLAWKAGANWMRDKIGGKNEQQ